MTRTETEDHTRPRTGSRGLQIAMIAAMFIGSIAMWLGSPALWLWLAGQTSAVSSTQMGSLVLVLIGIPITMVLIGKVLSRIDHRYTAIFGTGDVGNTRARWLQGVRGDGELPSMLDKVMVISVGIALLCVGTWYVFFSGGTAFRGA